MRSQTLMGMTQVLEKSVVTFSQNYLPLCRVNIKQAVVLLVTNKAEVLNFTTESGWHISSPSLVVYVPKHIRSKVALRERMWKVPPVNRREILRRDHYSCQYCDTKKDLTLDRVIPRSRGDRHIWDNVVAACSKCNSSKSDTPSKAFSSANRTPKESGMQLRKKPKAPVHPTIYFAEQFWKGVVQANLE